MSSPLGIAIIGCGYWGKNYVRLFSELDQTRVVVLCDQELDLLQKLRRYVPRAHITRSVEEAIATKGVDAVVVCTNAAAHYPIARRALMAGKHVLIEKPMTTSALEAAILTQLASDKNVKLLVGHIFLFNTGIEKIKALVDGGDVGHIYYLYARRTNLGPVRHDVNASWDLATHDVSIFNHLLNQMPTWVSASGARVLGYNQEDVSFITLRYPGDIHGHIHVSWADPNKVREVVVVGSNMRIAFNDLDPQERVRIYERGIWHDPDEPDTFGEHQLSVRDGDIISPYLPVTEPLKQQALHFIDCISNDLQPMCCGYDGTAVAYIMEAIDRSMEEHGAPIELSRGWEKLWTFANTRQQSAS